MAPRLPLPTSPTSPVAGLLPREHTPFALVFASHPRWPLPPDTRTSAGPPPRRVRVCVVESSWNPPTLAHVSLAQTCTDADAHLLALTIGNPDKGRIDIRAAAVRVEMMRQVALDWVRTDAERNGTHPVATRNIAIAVTEAPTFTEKSRVLRSELDALVQAQSGSNETDVRLTFPVGWDTLVRIFADRYYQPPGPDLASCMTSLLNRDDSSLVCARRGDVSLEDEETFLASPEVRKWVEKGKVAMVDLPEAARQVSSTRVREAVREQQWDQVNRDVPFEGVVEIIKRESLYRD